VHAEVMKKVEKKYKKVLDKAGVVRERRCYNNDVCVNVDITSCRSLRASSVG
jgi:hypothetical protein